MPCQKIYDPVEGKEKDLVQAPATDPVATKRDIGSLLHPGQEARDLVERHHRMLAELHAARSSD